MISCQQIFDFFERNDVLHKGSFRKLIDIFLNIFVVSQDVSNKCPEIMRRMNRFRRDQVKLIVCIKFVLVSGICEFQMPEISRWPPDFGISQAINLR